MANNNSLIKIINLPELETEFKIVQLYHGSQRVMLCGSRDLGSGYYHYAILEDYLKKNNILFGTFVVDPKFPLSIVPAMEKEGVYRIVGMGFAGIDRSVKYFQLPYGSSRDYKIKPSEEFKEILREMFSEDSSYWKEVKNNKI